MTRLPVIVGFGGANAAGRSSFHHGYRRMIIDVLDQRRVDSTLRSLAGMMGSPTSGAIGSEQRAQLLDHTLVRRIEPDWFDPDRAPLNRKLTVEVEGEPVSFVTRARNLPEVLPAGWRVTALDERRVRVDIHESSDLLVPSTEMLSVKAAGQLPTGFKPGKLYASRAHPRALEMAIYAASDAIGCMGISWETICQHVGPDRVSCYAGSAMAQLDENGNGGLLSNRYKGKRVSSKQLPFGLLDMVSDFVNAYVVGNVGSTAGTSGACATFLYNLRWGIEDIRSGRARVAIVGASEAPILPDIMEGYTAMGALGTDKDLLHLDAHLNLTEPNYRRACRPFSTNCGFTIAEGAQYIILMDDELALELGASIYGAVTDVFINADGFKKSISSPGVGNYITVAKAAATVRAILGDEALRQRSFIHAHGTGTPQNRVTESHIINETAKAFGIPQWRVAAIKAYIGHTLGVAPGDQLMSVIGTWADGWIPGVATIDHVATDVHRSHLAIGPEHVEVDPTAIDAALLNAKGFGGNNASAPVFAPHVALRMLEKRHGADALTAWRHRNETVVAQATAYDEAACAGDFNTIYRFDHNVMGGGDIELSSEAVRVPGFGAEVDLKLTSPFSEWL